MRLAVLTFFAISTLAMAAASPADAQSRRRASVEAYPGAGYSYVRARPRTRITVRKGRTYLDPGTEVLPQSRSYVDYAVPPLHYPSRIWDTTGNYRFPLPTHNWETGGYIRGWP